VRVEYDRGFRTMGEAKFLRPFWQSLPDDGKMAGKVSDHLTRAQIDTLVVLEINIAVAFGPGIPTLEDELLAFMSKDNRFETGRFPADFEKDRPPKCVVGLFRTKKGEYGLITRYAGFAVIELNGLVGVAPVKDGEPEKPAPPAKKADPAPALAPDPITNEMR